jgi:hypothetical protein
MRLAIAYGMGARLVLSVVLVLLRLFVTHRLEVSVASDLASCLQTAAACALITLSRGVRDSPPHACQATSDGILCSRLVLELRRTRRMIHSLFIVNTTGYVCTPKQFVLVTVHETSFRLSKYLST